MLIAKTACLPEFVRPILRKVEFWDKMRRLASRPISIELAYQISAISMLLFSTSQRKHFEEIKNAKIFELLVQTGNRTIASGNPNSSKVINMITQAVGTLGANLKFSPEFYDYKLSSGVDANDHILAEPFQSKNFVQHVRVNAPYRDDYVKSVKQKLRPIRCDFCHKPEKKKKLKTCGRCQSVFYCSRKCQKSAWTCHRKQCKKLK